ncbi:MAG: hypothetical protein Q9226_001737 [Calogaya cf. arnoldii]
MSDPFWAEEERELVIAHISNMQHQRDLVEAVQELCKCSRDLWTMPESRFVSKQEVQQARKFVRELIEPELELVRLIKTQPRQKEKGPG